MAKTIKSKLAVMDYNAGCVYVYDINVPSELTDWEEFIREFMEQHDHQFNNCYYMTSADFNVIYK